MVDVAVAVFVVGETGPVPETGGSTVAVIVSVCVLKAVAVPTVQTPVISEYPPAETVCD